MSNIYSLNLVAPRETELEGSLRSRLFQNAILSCAFSGSSQKGPGSCLGCPSYSLKRILESHINITIGPMQSLSEHPLTNMARSLCPFVTGHSHGIDTLIATLSKTSISRLQKASLLASLGELELGSRLSFKHCEFRDLRSLDLQMSHFSWDMEIYARQ